MKKNCQSIIFFLLLGTLSILGQTVLLREITSFFSGREIFYSFGLGFWLLFAGAGSLSGPKIFFLKTKRAIWLTLLILATALPLLIISLRFSVSKYFLYGQLPNLQFFLFFLLMLLPFCFFLGITFPSAVNVFLKNGARSANKGYLWETIGFIFGGILFSFILAPSSFPLPNKINRLTLSWRYPNLEEVFNSKYQQIIITETGRQKNFFLSGKLSFTNEENFENQQLFTLIKPFIGRPKKILSLCSPTLADFLDKELRPDTTDFLEIDSILLKLEMETIKSNFKPITGDAKKFFNRSKNKYDLIVFGLGAPQTLLENRLLTQESFGQIKNSLSETGVFILSFSLPTNFLSPEVLNFGGSVFRTFKNVFRENEFLVKEEQVILIGSVKPLPKPAHFANLAKVWFESTQRKQLLQKLSLVQTSINTDLQPVSFFYQQLFLQKFLSPNFPKFIRTIPFFLLAVLICLYLGGFFSREKNFSLGILMAGSSLTFLGLETLSIFLFQVKIGSLYGQISLIFSLFLLGMAAGIKLAKSISSPLPAFKRLSFFSILAILLFFLFLDKNVSGQAEIFFLFVFIFGLFNGANYSLINRLYFGRKGKNPGLIYAFDLFGGCLGAFTTTLFLPIYGAKEVLLGLALVIAANIFLTAKLRQS